MALSTSAWLLEDDDEELEPEDTSPEAVITSIVYNSSLRRSGVKYFVFIVTASFFYCAAGLESAARACEKLARQPPANDVSPATSPYVS